HGCLIEVVRTPCSSMPARRAIFGTIEQELHLRPCRTLAEDPGRTQPRAAYPRRCSSNASGLHGRNPARILGPSHERNSLVPRSRVSVARLSRSWALRAAPFALTGAKPSGLEVSGAEAQEIARPRAPAPARRHECIGHRW